MFKNISLIALSFVILFSPEIAFSQQTVKEICEIAEIEFRTYSNSPRAWRGEHPKVKAAKSLFKIIPTLTLFEEITLAAETSYQYFADTRGITGITNCSGPIKEAADRLTQLIPSMTDVNIIARSGKKAFIYYANIRGVTGMTDCSRPHKEAESRIHTLMKGMKTPQEIDGAVTAVKSFTSHYYTTQDLAAELMSRLKK